MSRGVTVSRGSTVVHVFHLFIIDFLMLEIIEMIVCPTFMSHIPDESLLNSSHPRDSHVKYDLSSSNHHAIYITPGTFRLYLL